MSDTKVDRWFTSDLHLGHPKVVVERGFSSVEEMDATILRNITQCVNPGSILYVLGDVSVAGPLKEETFLKLASIDCTKILIGGNHDPDDMELLSKVFHRVFGAHVLGTQNWLLTHVPVHELQVTPRFAANIHGHTHDNLIPHPKYLNVCVEQTNYWPLHIDEVKQRLRQQIGAA